MVACWPIQRRAAQRGVVEPGLGNELPKVSAGYASRDAKCRPLLARVETIVQSLMLDFQQGSTIVVDADRRTVHTLSMRLSGQTMQSLNLLGTQAPLPFGARPLRQAKAISLEGRRAVRNAQSQRFTPSAARSPRGRNANGEILRVSIAALPNDSLACASSKL